MTSHQREQKERRAVITNDQTLRSGDQQPTTLHAMSRLSNDLEGRHSARDYLSGSAQATDYPAIPSGPWSSDYARVPDEPPLGFDMNAVEPTGTPAEVAASIVAGNLISASAEETKTPKGGGASLSNIVRGSVSSPTLTRQRGNYE